MSHSCVFSYFVDVCRVRVVDHSARLPSVPVSLVVGATAALRSTWLGTEPVPQEKQVSAVVWLDALLPVMLELDAVDLLAEELAVELELALLSSETSISLPGVANSAVPAQRSCAVWSAMS